MFDGAQYHRNRTGRKPGKNVGRSIASMLSSGNKNVLSIMSIDFNPDISAAIAEIFEGEGIEVLTDVEVRRVAGRDGGVALTVADGGEREVSGSHLLAALGRKPNTDELGLEHAGIDLDDKGFIRVDDRLRTSADGVWAMGDCNGRGAFTHTSYNDYEIVAANLLDGEDRRVATASLLTRPSSTRPTPASG